jgi:hypothetical protein
MFSRLRLIALAVIAASFCLPLTVRSQTKAPLTHEAMWMMKRVGAPNPSPTASGLSFHWSSLLMTRRTRFLTCGLCRQTDQPNQGV